MIKFNLHQASLYILMVLFFLGLSKTLQYTENVLISVQDEASMASQFKGRPLSIVLLDQTKSGLLFKNYYQRLRLIYTNRTPIDITVKTTRAFSKKNEHNIGLCIFRRTEQKTIETFPLPPGALFLGDMRYGKWHFDSKLKKKVWHFHRHLHYLASLTNLDKKILDIDLILKIQNHRKNKEPLRNIATLNSSDNSKPANLMQNHYFGRYEREKLPLKLFLKTVLLEEITH